MRMVANYLINIKKKDSHHSQKQKIEKYQFTEIFK